MGADQQVAPPPGFELDDSPPPGFQLDTPVKPLKKPDTRSGGQIFGEGISKASPYQPGQARNQADVDSLLKGLRKQPQPVSDPLDAYKAKYLGPNDQSVPRKLLDQMMLAHVTGQPPPDFPAGFSEVGKQAIAREMQSLYANQQAMGQGTFETPYSGGGPRIPLGTVNGQRIPATNPLPQSMQENAAQSKGPIGALKRFGVGMAEPSNLALLPALGGIGPGMSKVAGGAMFASQAPQMLERAKSGDISGAATEAGLYGLLPFAHEIAGLRKPGVDIGEMPMRPSGKDLQPFQRLKKPSPAPDALPEELPSAVKSQSSYEDAKKKYLDLNDKEEQAWTEYQKDTENLTNHQKWKNAFKAHSDAFDEMSKVPRGSLPVDDPERHVLNILPDSKVEFKDGETTVTPNGQKPFSVKFTENIKFLDNKARKLAEEHTGQKIPLDDSRYKIKGVWEPDTRTVWLRQDATIEDLKHELHHATVEGSTHEAATKAETTTSPPTPAPPASTGEGQAPPSKTVWQMTKAENRKWWEENAPEVARDAEERDAVHRMEIERALREGKPIHFDVLREYPDIVQRYIDDLDKQQGQEGEANALQESGPNEVLQQQPEQNGGAGSGRGGVEPVVQGQETPPQGQAQKEVTPKTLEQIVDEHDWVTSAPRAKQMLSAAQDISDRLDAGEKLSTKAASVMGVKHGIPAPDMASLYKDIKASRVEATSPLPEAPIKPLGTLQSSVLPGAEEFIKQDVGPAFEATKAAPGRIRQALGAIFNPPGIDEAAGQTARIIRGQSGEMARQTELAHSILKDAKNYFRKALIARPPETSKGVAYSHPAIQFMDAVENGRPTGNAGLDATAQAIREGFDKRAAEAQKLGILNETIEDYFPHIWKKPGLTENIKAWIGGRRPFAGPESFRKQRSIPTISEGLEQGLKPVSWNPIDLSLLKMREMDRSLMAHKAFNEMKEQGLAKFVRFGQDVPEGYRKLDDKIARVLERQETTKVSGDPGAPQFVMRGNYYAPEAAARVFNNYLSPGLRGNPLFDIAHGTSNVLNQAQLGLSAFHLMFTGLDAATAKTSLGLQKVSEGKLVSGGLDLAKSAIPLYAPLETLLQGHKGIKAYFDPKLAEGNPLFKEIDALQKAGGRVKMDSFYHNSAAESFWNALENHNYPGAVLRLPLALLHAASYPIMQAAVPRMKMGVFMDMARYELSRLPKDATIDQQRKVLQDSWDSVDNRMGQLVYDNLFWNRALKDAGLASVRSLGWNLGTIREVGGGVKDILGTSSRLKEGGPIISRRMGYDMALPMQVALAGSIIYYLANGKPPPTLRDAMQPTVNGTRYQPASYMKDIFPLYNAYQQEGVQGTLMRGKKMAQSKVNPGMASLIEMMNNEDYFGNKIRNDNDPLVKRALDEANYVAKQFTPFSLRDNPYKLQTSGQDRTLQILGITRVPKDRTSDEEKHMQAIRELMQERDQNISPFGKGLGSPVNRPTLGSLRRGG